jgi:hypothetical protein
MTKLTYAEGVQQGNFTPANLFALFQIVRVVEELVGKTSPLVIEAVTPASVLVGTKSTLRTKAIYEELWKLLTPLNYTVIGGSESIQVTANSAKAAPRG